MDKPAHQHSIVLRLTAILVATVLLVTLVSVATMHRMIARATADAFEKKADETLLYLAGTLEMPLWTVDHDSIRTIGRAVSNDASISGLTISDDSGAVIFASNRPITGSTIERAGRIRHIQHGVPRDVGEVRVALSPENASTGDQLLLTTTIVALLILVAAVSATAIFVRRALKKPLDSLDRIAANFTAGRYEAPALPYREFQPFGQTLTQMAGTIEHQMNVIRATEAKYREIFENAIEGIFQATLEGRYLRNNPAMAVILGFAPGEDLSQSIGDIAGTLYVHQEARGRMLQEIVEHGSVSGYEVQIRRKDGKPIWVSVSARIVRDEGGRPLYIEGFLTDITERRLAREEVLELNRMLERRVAERTAQLEAANHDLEAFAYSISHDLRAPLRHIHGFLSLLSARVYADLDDTSRKHMENIRVAAKHMDTLIDDLLSFARDARAEMRAERVDLNVLAAEVITCLEPDCRGREIDWQVKALPTIHGDRAMLRVVLTNLISNAIKFTRTRRPAAIEIACLPQEGAEIVVFIRDNGVGFDMRYADQLFGVFKRLHRAEEFEGTGIGLANVRQVIGRHGGRVWATGEIDRGATFYFSLPHACDEEMTARH